MQAGSSGSAVIQVTRGGSFTGTVSLTVDGEPGGVTAALSSATVASGSNGTTLTVDSSATPGTYPLTVAGTGSGVSTAATVYTLTVTALPDPDPDFGVELATTTFTIQQGDSIATPVIVRRVGGFTGDVGLFVTGAPTDVQARVTPNPTADTIASLGISVSVLVAPGTYPLVLTASEVGPRTRTVDLTLIVTPKPTAGALTLSPSSIEVVQTQPSAPIVVRLVRPPGVTGPAEFTFQSFSNGMTGTCTPNPASGDSALLVINTTLLSSTGSRNATIRASVLDATSTAELLVTTRAFVPPDFGLSLTPAVASVTAGSATTTAIAIARTNFTDPVALTVSGMPVGMTASVTPASATADSATLDVSTTPTVAPGVYPLVVQGTAAGVTGTRTTTVSITVNAPMGGGNVQWQFCEPSRFPLWFGVRSGTSGAWTQVSATNNSDGVSYAFPFDQTGQLAYVRNTTDGVAITVFNSTPQEVLAQAASECANFRPTKTFSGRIVTINSLRGASIVAGGAAIVVPAPGGNFTLSGIKDGLTDIISVMGIPDSTGWERQERIIFRRDVNPADGAVLADFDFTGTEWLFRNGANFSFRNLGGEMFTVERSYVTGNGNAGPLAIFAPSADSSVGLTGMPPAFRRPGDLHQVIATTVNATAPRTVTGYNINFNSPAVHFGPTLAAPTVSVLSSVPVRVRAEGTWSAAYGSAVAATFSQQAGAPNARSVAMRASRGFFGAAGSFVIETPDFTGAPGFNASWLLQAGVSTTHTVTATGVGLGTSLTPADDTQIISGSRIGTVTP